MHRVFSSRPRWVGGLYTAHEQSVPRRRNISRVGKTNVESAPSTVMEQIGKREASVNWVAFPERIWQRPLRARSRNHFRVLEHTQLVFPERRLSLFACPPY